MKHRAAYRRELRAYVTGLVLAVLLSAVAFGCVALGLPRDTALWVVAVAGMAQVIVHFRYFLHIDLSQSKRDDLQLILFSALIMVMMVGGTIWVLTNLSHRMM